MWLCHRYAFNIFTTKWSYKWVSREISWITDSSHVCLSVSCSQIVFVDDKGCELFWPIGTQKSDLQQESVRVFVMRLTVQNRKGLSTQYNCDYDLLIETNGLYRPWWCCRDRTIWALALKSTQSIGCEKKNHSRNRTMWIGLKSGFRNLTDWNFGKNINIVQDLKNLHQRFRWYTDMVVLSWFPHFISLRLNP